MSRSIKILIQFFVLLSSLNLIAQLSEPALEARSEKNVETFLFSKDSNGINKFIDENMAPASEAQRIKTFEKLSEIRERLSLYLDGIGVGVMNNTLIFELSSEKGAKRLKVTLDHENDSISDLQIEEMGENMTITLNNLQETIDGLEAEGFSGLIHFRIKGKVHFERGFGMANAKMNLENNPNTIFGIGSRPIDFTVAAIYLLRQRGLLNLNDRIAKFVKNVPNDKSTMTINHLLTGQSGFPDFFHTSEDWDADLRYINRQEAVERLMELDLLFRPGEDRKHSHAAFGLLAALIEIISGETYYGFIRSNFLDPAKMNRTGEYGESRNLTLSDFAVGNGPNSNGIPNIPPNWGKTSWLIKGSGGMYSTLNDLLKFYRLVRSGEILNSQNNNIFKRPTANLDGSDRGFELFNIFFPSGTEVFLFLNNMPDQRKARATMKALEGLASKHK